MHLIKLSLFKNSETVREVAFRKGLNLIVNSSSSNNKSGNSVGKSTLSRLLDYIFLSSGKDIYTEPEFGKEIPEVCDFIENNTIYVELEFKGHDKSNYLVGRTLTKIAKDSRYYIDRHLTDIKLYTELISTQIFGQYKEKPSVRNLSHKFIRNTNEKMQNTTRFLHATTKPDIYDQIYLFLFGFDGLDLLKDKALLNNQIRTKERHLAAYRNPHRESALQKMILPLKKEEEQLKAKIENFDFSGSEESSVKELVDVQRDISNLTIEYTKVRSRIDYVERSVDSLKDNASSVDGKELSSIYEDAGVSINGELRRSYQDLVVFHNHVIANKVKLLQKDIEQYRIQERKIKFEIDELHDQESNIFKDINEPDTLKSIGQVYNDISKTREQIASVSALLGKIEDTKRTIEELENSKAKVIENISDKTESLDRSVEIFNSYFGDLSKSFYGDRYIFDLEFDIEKEKCRFDIASISPNPTGGKKKGELSAFDMAYIDFVNSTNLRRPTFVIHDSIEDVDINQIWDIFSKANEIDGQYIVALLSDKISDSRFSEVMSKNVILELSEDDKFFKI